MPDDAPATNALLPAKLKEGVRGSDVLIFLASIIPQRRHIQHSYRHSVLPEYYIALHDQ